MPYLFLLCPFLLLIPHLACQSDTKTSEQYQASPLPVDTLGGEEIPEQTDLPLDDIQLPKGFSLSIYASEVPNARSLEWSPNGTLFVGNRAGDKVFALRDTDGNGIADRRWVIDESLQMPNGVAFLNGDLYVAEVSRILKYPNIEQRLSDPPEPEVVFDDYPTETHHGWKYIAFGPDGKLYVPVGAPCNICHPDDSIFCTITRLNPDGSNMEVVQHGIRNTVGFSWHPETGELWFTDNGRDWLGDDLPACELNHASEVGQHFGYPFCHQGDLPDPEFGDLHECAQFRAPVQNLGPHVAPLGLEFYTGSLFPEEYRQQVFIAEHGSWNRSEKIGYRVTLVRLNEQGESLGYEDFATGWLQPGEEVWGRPVDLELLPDGRMLVSDDYAGAVYAIGYP